MPYSTGKAPKTYTYIDSATGRNVTMKKKQTLPSGKTVYAESFEKPKKRNYANPQRGAKTGTAVGNALRSVFGGSPKSTASTPKAKKSWSSNPARAERQKARAKGKEKVCGPNGCMTRNKLERLRDR